MAKAQRSLPEEPAAKPDRKDKSAENAPQDAPQEDAPQEDSPVATD